MARFRQRPIFVDAERWRPGYKLDGVCYCAFPTATASGGVVLAAHVHTPNGPISLQSGDWLVTTEGGSRFPVSDELFTAFYEAA